ncbi:hypothetical protein [Enterococcus sp. BWR-S5]|uniref:hypothetical protein n=1 Tax=Enterococcus sp. BWR-S5 TaxID=2787714 RepID=UPI0019240EEF|nr:hypothetical protein [Enterococcus sp. BWR-S5]MBL1223735.1 hypothetical protein [Enterococcus sp. BWR-S5]
MILNEETIENVSSPYTVENLTPNTTYTAKVVNEDGESNTVTFKTKEITYKEVTITCDYVNKVAGSVVENANIAKMQGSQTLLNPDSSSFYELTQSRYDGIKELSDGKRYTVTNATINNRLQVALYYDVFSAFESYDSNYFSDRQATTNEEKAAVVNQEVIKAVSNVHGFGSSLDSTSFRTAVFVNAAWSNETVTTGTEIKQNTIMLDSVQTVSDGLLCVLVYADASGGTAETASALNIDYTNLELTILVEED